MSQTLCLECDAPLQSERSQGLCPRCLLKLGLSTQLDSASIRDAGERRLIAPPLFPFEFGHYRVTRLLGRGGMGAVYEAEDLRNRRRVALKVLGRTLESTEARQRFLREGLLAASINHSHCVYVFGTEEIEDVPVITMELVPGGTLQDLVQKSGPLPVKDAVDRILEVLSGLESAHAVGVLHRDVKPSNCFVDSDGSVKVGDFGLSISTLAQPNLVLTTAGRMIGTPAFSAPEQLRGETVDARADFYSVGATLYYLVTGKPPFFGDNLVGVLAEVLDKPAPSPRHLRPEIPEGLDRVILRCLSKAADERHRDYAELRRALLPFASSAPVAAPLAKRILAHFVDRALLRMPFLVGGSLGMSETLQRWAWAPTVLSIAYFGFSEWRWGSTPGKRFFGLRVSSQSGGTPRLGQTLARAATFDLFKLLGLITSGLGFDSIGWVLTQFGLVYHPLLAISARARNGYATLLDFATGTRVVLDSRQPAPQERPVSELHSDIESSAQRCGPYHLLERIDQGASSELWVGFDARMMRKVWVRKLSHGEPEVADFLRNVSRSGRLRWLQGQRGELNWDAYEHAPGQPLMALLQKPNPWKAVCGWLKDLAEEIAAAEADGSLPQKLSLDRIWITSAGRAKLLDFPVQAGRDPSLAEINEPQAFLNQIAISALEGRCAKAAEAQVNAPRLPLPIGIKRALVRLTQNTTIPEFVHDLKGALQRAGNLLPWQRALLALGPTLPALWQLFFGLLAMASPQVESKPKPQWVALRDALRMHEALEEGREVTNQSPQPKLGSLETYIADRFRKTVQTENSEAKMTMTLSTDADSDKERLQQILDRNPHPTQEEVSRAKADLGDALNSWGDPVWLYEPDLDWPLVSQRARFRLSATLLIAVLAALIARSGLVMRSLGITVVLPDGSPANRWRAAWRATLHWAWWWPALWAFSIEPAWGPLLGGALTLGALGVMLTLALRGKRALCDRLAGTWIVQG
jgi:uncharacterized RDD family membrane protein YckC